MELKQSQWYCTLTFDFEFISNQTDIFTMIRYLTYLHFNVIGINLKKIQGYSMVWFNMTSFHVIPIKLWQIRSLHLYASFLTGASYALLCTAPWRTQLAHACTSDHILDSNVKGWHYHFVFFINRIWRLWRGMEMAGRMMMERFGFEGVIDYIFWGQNERVEVSVSLLIWKANSILMFLAGLEFFYS